MNKQEKLGMIELREKGYTYSKIGKLFGLSRQRVHQILSGYDKLNGCDWYNKLKQSVLDRDKSCQKCGSAENLVVHHIDGNDRNNSLGNLITLCHSCHGGLHAASNGGKPCTMCSETFKGDFNRYAYSLGYCPNCWDRKLSEKRERRWYTYTCEVCGEQRTIRRIEIRKRQKRGLGLPRFCSNKCRNSVWYDEVIKPLRKV